MVKEGMSTAGTTRVCPPCAGLRRRGYTPPRSAISSLAGPGRLAKTINARGRGKVEVALLERLHPRRAKSNRPA